MSRIAGLPVMAMFAFLLFSDTILLTAATNEASSETSAGASQSATVWQAVPGALTQIAVGPDNNVWGLAGNRVFHYNSLVQGWQQVPGLLSQLAVGFGGEVWGITSAGLIYRYDTDHWVNIPGNLSQIAVGANGDVWGISPTQFVYRYDRDAQSWQWVNGWLKQLSVGSDGTVWGLTSASLIYRYDSAAHAWSYVPGFLSQIAVGSSNNVWGLTAAGLIYRFNSQTQSWDNVPGILNQISVAFDGSVWGLTQSDQIYQFNSATQNWDFVPGFLNRLTVAAKGIVWGLTRANAIYRNSEAPSVTPTTATNGSTVTVVPSSSPTVVSTPSAATPILTQSSNAYASATAVHMSCSTASSTIFYTTNGSTPSHNSPSFMTDVGVPSSETVKAICSAPGYSDSSVAALTLLIASPPLFSIPSGTYSTSQAVSISCASPFAMIHYTTNGDNPSISSPVFTPGYPLIVSVSELISAKCFSPGYISSATAGIAVVVPQPQSAIQTLSLTVDQTASITNIPADFLGLSFDATIIGKSWFRTSNTVLSTLLTNLGTGTIRTGASGVDYTYWTRDPVMTNPNGQATLHPSDIDNMFAFINNIGWKVIFGLNLLAGNPAMDADEATYVMQSAGSNLLAFEIGNEPDGYVGTGQKASYSYNTFKADFDLFAQTIRAAAPGAPIAGPVTSNHWLTTFLQDESPQITLVSQHYYAAPNFSPTLLSASAAAKLTSVIAGEYLAAQQYKLPLRMAETNSEWQGLSTGDIANTFMEALWVADYLFSTAQQSIAGVNMHGGIGQCKYYSVLCSANGTVSPQAAYYSMLLFHYAAAQGQMVQISSPSNQDVTAYAIKGNNGTLKVVLINKSFSTPFIVQLSPGRTYVQASAQRLKSSSVLATSGITFAGNAVAADGTWVPGAPEGVLVSKGVYSIQLPAASAVVISFQ